jgi:hypothetical protein
VPAERSGIRAGVREHLLVLLGVAKLSASDRAALQSLIPLASGLGAGTIFGLFFVGRRRPGFAVFESIAIVAVLIAVATTAYYAIALLHRDTAITNRELVETSIPLVVAAVLLILISIVARLRGTTQRVSVLMPLVLVAVIATIELASSGVAIEPGAAPVVALALLAVGAGFGALGTYIDGRERRAARRAEHDRLALLMSRGYAVADAPLAAALPRLPGEEGRPSFDLWRRDDHVFVDGPGAVRLRDAVDERWQSLARGDARGPVGPLLLLEVETSGGPRRADSPTELRLATLRPGAEPPRHTAALAVNNDGLFDITGLL